MADSTTDAGIEVTGVVKWFDTVKGYGFIKQITEGAERGRDILLHQKNVMESGFLAVYEGSIVTCKVAFGKKGLYATRLLSLDNSKATHRFGAEKAFVVTPDGPEFEAQVKWFDRNKGYGFVTCGPDTEDVFVHLTLLREIGIRELQQGQRVKIRARQSARGRIATEISLLV
jgi:CspA family cold shock protein